MKRALLLFLGFLLLSIPSVFSTEQETAQTLIAWVDEAIAAFKKEGVDLQFVNPEAAGQIFYIKNNHYIELKGTFSSGNAFFFFVCDGREATNIGVQILDENGNVVGEDIQGKNHAVGVLEPEVTGTYYIRLVLFETTGVPAAHVGYLLMYVPTT